MQHLSEENTVFLGFGSNLGAREQVVICAVEQIGAMPGMQMVACSPLYESPALLPLDAPEDWDMPFINAVACFETEQDADAILQMIQSVERKADKTYRGFWGPRELDIDILAYGSQIIHRHGLSIPHPALAERDFVLLPWRDIAPNWVPFRDGLTITQLCQSIDVVTARPLVAQAA